MKRTPALRRLRRGVKPNQMEKLLAALKDGTWHSTNELVRRVGCTFGHAKFQLVNYGYPIEKRAHPTRHHQYQYRLADSP